MKRIAKVLVVCMLMMVLMASTVSPAFATQPWSTEWGYGDQGDQQEKRWGPNTKQGCWGYGC